MTNIIHMTTIIDYITGNGNACMRNVCRGSSDELLDRAGMAALKP
jgi:hypothetical protein